MGRSLVSLASGAPRDSGGVTALTSVRADGSYTSNCSLRVSTSSIPRRMSLSSTDEK